MQDFRYLVKRGGNAWNVTKPVPRHLRPIVKKSNLRRSLQTTDPAIARQRRWAVLAEFQQIIDAAQKRYGGNKPTTANAMIAAELWRESLDQAKVGCVLDDAEEVLEDCTKYIAGALGPATAEAFHGIATGTATPLLHYVDSWLREGGVRGPATPRSQGQFRSTLQGFADWCQTAGIPLTVEAVTKRVTGRFVTERFVARGVDPATSNKHISALSSYWSWMIKRTGLETNNPWEKQSRFAARDDDEDRNKRPFTNDEVRTLLQPDVDRELADVMRVGALSGMRLDEIYRLTVHDCRAGIFDIRRSKTRAGVRRFPIHSGLVDIVARRCAGKAPTEYLFHEAGPQEKRGRSGPMSQRFSRFRIAQGVDEREPGKRQSKIDFNSFRRWFITTARRTIDRAKVAVVVGHKAGNITDDVYNGGPELEERRMVVEAVRLPS